MDQLAFPGADAGNPRRRAKSKRPPEALAPTDPVAHVVVDLKNAALDREFDYSVPARLDALAKPGCRVRVRFGHRLVNAYIVGRSAETDHGGELTPVKNVLGPPVLTADSLRLARAVAHRYAGTLPEILRDAVPRRLAAAELTVKPRGSLVAALGNDRPEPARTSLTLSTSTNAPAEVAREISKYESAIVVVPDQRTIDHFLPDLKEAFGSRLSVLNSNDSAFDRYQSFLNVLAGNADIVLGTRNAVFAPVPGRPLIVVWNDGDESLAEPRSPGWHAREVAALRSFQSGCPLLIAGFVQTVEAARLVETGWLKQLRPSRDVREKTPTIISAANQRADDATSSSRIPHFAWEVLKSGLKQGPVLVQVARSGYFPAMACRDCGEVVTCPQCAGSIGKAGTGELSCKWCGHQVAAFSCRECEGTALRAVRVGSSRTADELRAAFQSVPVVVSGGQVGILDTVGNESQIVVATPGAEPRAASGFGAALLLDGDALLARSDLRTEEQTLRRWFAATALVRDRGSGGVVAITANPRHRCVQALVRADPTWWARTEYLERTEAQLPPSVRSASFSGPSGSLTTVVDALTSQHPGWRVLGPVLVPARSKRVNAEVARSVVLVPTSEGQELADQISETRRDDRLRSAADALRIRMDPLSLSADT